VAKDTDVMQAPDALNSWYPSVVG